MKEDAMSAFLPDAAADGFFDLALLEDKQNYRR
jgi:hypothetical protein